MTKYNLANLARKKLWIYFEFAELFQQELIDITLTSPLFDIRDTNKSVRYCELELFTD